MLEQMRYGPRKILAGGLGAWSVNEGEGVEPHLGELEGHRKAVMHCAHVGEASACVADGRPRAFLAAEEDEASVHLTGIVRDFFRRVDVQDDRDT